jgi:DNA adenine methylase
VITNDTPWQRLINFEGDKERFSIIPKSVPFLKWAGGKRKLVDIIIAAATPSFNRYLEPFVGGGAVALALGYQPMLLNDSNTELMNTYRVVRDDLENLLALLDVHQKMHTETYFYAVRAQNPNTLNPCEQAARFIYLNKTCFNGLYRVNKHGQFNVPYGKYTNPILYDRDNIFAASQVLRGAAFYAEDYCTFLKEHTQPGDFIYLDPPYMPISQYSDFKRYTKEQFREDDQLKLAQVYNDLIELGAYPVLSNSYSEATLDLYAQHDIQVVYASRNINHEGTGRVPIPEILVKPRR